MPLCWNLQTLMIVKFVLDNIVEIPQFNVGQTTTIRRDNSGWRPYDTGTFISYASNGITLSDEGTCK